MIEGSEMLVLILSPFFTITSLHTLYRLLVVATSFANILAILIMNQYVGT
jgi:hypothetical protein